MKKLSKKQEEFFIKALDDLREELRRISTIDIVEPAAGDGGIEESKSTSASKPEKPDRRQASGNGDGSPTSGRAASSGKQTSPSSSTRNRSVSPPTSRRQEHDGRRLEASFARH